MCPTAAWTHPEHGQDDPADFFLLRVCEDVGQDGDYAKPVAEDISIKHVSNKIFNLLN